VTLEFLTSGQLVRWGHTSTKKSAILSTSSCCSIRLLGFVSEISTSMSPMMGTPCRSGWYSVTLTCALTLTAATEECSTLDSTVPILVDTDSPLRYWEALASPDWEGSVFYEHSDIPCRKHEQIIHNNIIHSGREIIRVDIQQVQERRLRTRRLVISTRSCGEKHLADGESRLGRAGRGGIPGQRASVEHTSSLLSWRLTSGIEETRERRGASSGVIRETSIVHGWRTWNFTVSANNSL